MLKDTEVTEITGEPRSHSGAGHKLILAKPLPYTASPIIGAVLGALAMRSFMSDISTAAQRTHQLRWMLKNQKVDVTDGVN